MSNLNSFIREHSQGLGIGCSAYVDCPNCGRKLKFGITKYYDKVLYQCFSQSCIDSNGRHTKGSLDVVLDALALSDLLTKTYYPVPVREFQPEDHWIDGFNTVEAIELAKKYSLIDAYYTHKAFKTSTDIKRQRQVFYYTDTNGKVIGATGRSLIAAKPKALVYPYSKKSPWAVGASNEAVIVEDHFSAVKAYNCGFTGISLSGTNLQQDWLGYFRNYNRLFIALDKDAAQKAVDIRKSLQYFVNECIIVLLDKDLKDMTDVEAAKFFGKVV